MKENNSADWTIRLWYQWAVMPDESTCPGMFYMKEFEKGEESKVIEWLLENKGSIHDYYITDGSKKLKVTLESR